MPTDPLDPVLAEAAVETHLLHRAELEAVGRAVSGVDPDEFIAAVVFAPGLSWSGQDRPHDYFEIHSRHWSIDVSDAGNRRLLVTAAAAAALVDALRLPLSTTWVTRVLPAVLTVRSVRRDDGGVHFRLRRHPGPLPPHLSDTINGEDYAGFVSTVETAGPTLTVAGRGTIEFTSR
jgi:hypothetical protein